MTKPHKSFLMAIHPPERLDMFAFVTNLTFLVVFSLLIAKAFPPAFSWTINWFALLPAASVIVNLMLLHILARRPAQGEALNWFSIFVMFNLLWGVCEFCQRLASTAVGNAFWSHIDFGLISFIPTFFYLFIRSYTRRSVLSDSWRAPVVLIGFASSIAMLISSEHMFTPTPESMHQYWGYPAPVNAAAIIFVAWNMLITVAAAVRLAGAYRADPNLAQRQQYRWLAVTSLALAGVEALSAVILPALGVYWLPALGVAANTVMAAAVIFTMYRYGTFSINIGQLADAVLAGMAEAVVVTDQAGQIAYANHAAEALLARDGQVLVGEHISRMSGGRFGQVVRGLSPASRHKQQQTAVVVETPQKTRHLNVLASRADELGWGHILVLSDVTTLKDANEKLTNSQTKLAASLGRAKVLEQQLRHEKAGIEGRVKQATATLRSEHARLETAINSLNVGLIITDASGKLIMVNHETQVLLSRGLGLKVAGLGIAATGLTGALDRSFKLSERVADCIASGKAQQYANQPLKDRVVNLVLSPILERTSGGAEVALGAIALLEDVTESQNLQRARDEFFSIASHELRTPLTAIRGNTRMIQDYYAAKIDDHDVLEMLGDIHESSVRLIAIVNDFLDVSRLEQGQIKFSFNPVDTVALAKDVVSELNISIDSAKVKLGLEIPKQPIPKVMVDRDRLKQVLINLVGNALKFTERGSILIGFDTIGSSLAISVQDTGRGIPPAAQHRLFRKFQQANDNILTRDPTRSTGLGLYISRQIIEGMHGTIELTSSQVDVGSTFTVTLPLSARKQNAPKVGQIA